MPEGTGLDLLAAAAPQQYIDVGIAEQHAVTLAGGLACGGLKPVVAIYSTFLQRAYDQIVHDICIQNLPVAFVIDRAGLVGDDGPTHNGTFDLAYLADAAQHGRDGTERRERIAAHDENRRLVGRTHCRPISAG